MSWCGLDSRGSAWGKARNCGEPNNEPWLNCVWYVMAHVQKPDFVFRRNGRVHLNRQGGASFQSINGSRGGRISGSNDGYIMFRGSVKSTGYTSVDYWQPRCAHQR
jgi:hypothetical protein